VSLSLPRFISDTLDILTISAFLVGSGTYDCLDDDVEGSSLSVAISNFENGELLFEALTDARQGSFALSDLPVQILRMGNYYSKLLLMPVKDPSR
jgi:hypothetical protein